MLGMWESMCALGWWLWFFNRYFYFVVPKKYLWNEGAALVGRISRMRRNTPSTKKIHAAHYATLMRPTRSVHNISGMTIFLYSIFFVIDIFYHWYFLLSIFKSPSESTHTNSFNPAKEMNRCIPRMPPKNHLPYANNRSHAFEAIHQRFFHLKETLTWWFLFHVLLKSAMHK